MTIAFGTLIFLAMGAAGGPRYTVGSEYSIRSDGSAEYWVTVTNEEDQDITCWGTARSYAWRNTTTMLDEVSSSARAIVPAGKKRRIAAVIGATRGVGERPRDQPAREGKSDDKWKADFDERTRWRSFKTPEPSVRAKCTFVEPLE